MLFTLLFLTFFLPVTAGLSCIEDCSEVKCTIPTNCKAGLVPDACHCCKRCARAEGETCGGEWDLEGTCADGLKCVIAEDDESEIGHCRKQEDKSLCSKKKCGFRQQCIITKRNKAVCICPRNCRDNKMDPVCGYRNGKQYRNTCELFRHECRSGKEIGYYNGVCKRCFYKRKSYRMKEARKGQAPCETCVCHHGDWVCQTKKPCEERLEFCTIFDDPVSGLHTSTCPAGFTCKVQIPGIPEQNIPGVGKCVPDNVTVSNSTSNKNMPTAQSSKKALPSVCELPLQQGSCDGSISRWYYNKNRKKCLKFTFTGCDGNANNFRTKSSCRNRCMRRKGFSSKTTRSPMSTVTSKHNSKPTKTPEKVKNMTAICHLPPAPGPCRAAMPQWYYNPKRQRCSQFIYGGCGGNDNNFDSKEQCKAACMRNKGKKPLKHATDPTSVSFISETTPPSTITPISERRGPTSRYSTTTPTLAMKRRTSMLKRTSTGRGTAKPSTPTHRPTTREFTTREVEKDKTTKRMASTENPTAHEETTHKPVTTRHKQTKQPVTHDPTVTPQSTRQQEPSTLKPAAGGSMKTRLRTEAAFKCPCSECKRRTGKSTCSSHFGCFTSQVKHADGRVTVSYGCLEDEDRYTLLCNVRKPDQREPKMILECCRGHMCNLDRALPTKATPTSSQTPSKQSSNKPDTPGCYDANRNKFFGEGQEWKPNDCTVCTCRVGKPSCVASVCKHPRCVNPVRVPGQCCPVCNNKNDNITEDSREMIKALSQSQLTTVLVSINKPTDQQFCEDVNTGELYLSGQNWNVDDCTTCYCQRDGKIACAVQMCGGYPGCSKPVKEKGQCCPVCKDENDDASSYPENEVVNSPDSCLDSVTGDYYRHSEMWQQDDCTACICGQDRKYQCRKTKCKELTCKKKIKLKGRCCPACASETKLGCSFEGQKFLQGEFKLLADHCTLCECSNSEWICSSSRCDHDKKAV